jgi:hypothetical protein
MGKELGVVAPPRHPSYGRKYKIVGWQSRPVWAKKKQNPVSNKTKAKRAGGVPLEVEHCLASTNPPIYV